MEKLEFEDRREVMTVFSCVVAGVGSVTKMSKVIKEVQPSVSAKLQWLRENGFVNKYRWKYEPNWSKILKSTQKIFQEELSKKIVVSDDLMKTILVGYSKLLLNGYPKLTLREMINKFLDQLYWSFDEELKDMVDDKISSELVRIHNSLKSRSIENERFFYALLGK